MQSSVLVPSASHRINFSYIVLALFIGIFLYSHKARAQKSNLKKLSDSLTYTSDLQKQRNRIVEYILALKPIDILSEKQKYKHLFFRDPTAEEDRLVISFDTIIGKHIVRRKKPYKGNKDILFENRVFHYPVMLVGETFDGKVTFRNCIFMQTFLIGGEFKKPVVFEQNAFVKGLQFGGEKISAVLDSGARLHRNVFFEPLLC